MLNDACENKSGLVSVVIISPKNKTFSPLSALLLTFISRSEVFYRNVKLLNEIHFYMNVLIKIMIC